MTATIVETGQLLETIFVSVVAGVGVTVIFSVAIWGAARFTDLSHEDRKVAAGTALATSGLALAGVVAAITFGIVVMTSK